VQLWTALPGEALGIDPHFEHHADLPVARHDGAVVQVFVGGLAVGAERLESPATTYTPLVGAQLDLEPGAEVRLDVDPGHEHALLVDTGEVTFEGHGVPASSLGYLAPGRRALTVRAGASSPARAVLIGGLPFPEDVVMWWNFMGRTHEDVARARADWMAQVADRADGTTAYTAGAAGRRFGEVVGYASGPLRAPALPELRLKPRVRPPPAPGPRPSRCRSGACTRPRRAPRGSARPACRPPCRPSVSPRAPGCRARCAAPRSPRWTACAPRRPPGTARGRTRRRPGGRASRP